MSGVDRIGSGENRRFGINISNFDVKTTDVSGSIELQKLLAEHGLIIFRNQVLDDADLVRFGKLIGDGRL
jgi:hypothetical protein